MARVTRLCVYPVKGLGGVDVESAVVTATGFELDRAWCVVDESGARYAAMEALSNRKLSALMTLTVEIEAETLCIRAPAEFKMSPLRVPIDVSSYADRRELVCTSSGKSTTDPNNAGWILGEMTCRSAGEEASAWLSTYLNDPAVDRQKRKKPLATYTLARSMEAAECRDMLSYPPIFPIIEAARADQRWRGNRTRFHDFAPFLVVNQASVRALSVLCDTNYPIDAFRGSIIVDGGASDGDTLEPWAEETWRKMAIGDVAMSKIKECPRCTVPCRNPATGEYLFEGRNKLKLWATLKKEFPGKANDEEWSTWKGVFFGVYFGHNNLGAGKTIRVGDRLTVVEWTTWDAHIRARNRFNGAVGTLLVGVGAIALELLAVRFAPNSALVAKVFRHPALAAAFGSWSTFTLFLVAFILVWWSPVAAVARSVGL